MHCCIYSWQKLLFWLAFKRIESSSYNFTCLKTKIIFHRLASGSLHFKSCFSSATHVLSVLSAIEQVTIHSGLFRSVPVYSCCLGVITNRALFVSPLKSVLVGMKELNQLICDLWVLWFLGECFWKRKEVAWFYVPVNMLLGFPGGSVVKYPPATQKSWVQSLGQEDPLEKEMATYFSILAWEIPWTEEPGRLHSPWGCKRRTQFSN